MALIRHDLQTPANDLPGKKEDIRWYAESFTD